MRKIDDELAMGGFLSSASNLDSGLGTIFLSDMLWPNVAEDRYSRAIKIPEGIITVTITAPNGDMVTTDDKELYLYLVRKTLDRAKANNIPDREISITLDDYLNDTQQDCFPAADQMIVDSLRRLQATQFKLDIEVQGTGVLRLFKMIASFNYDYELIGERNVIKSFRVRHVRRQNIWH